MRSEPKGKSNIRAVFGSSLFLLALVFGPSAWTRSINHLDEAPTSNTFSFHFGHADCHHDDVNHGTCCLEVPRVHASTPSQSSSSKRQNEKKPGHGAGTTLLRNAQGLCCDRLPSARLTWRHSKLLALRTHHSIAVTILLI